MTCNTFICTILVDLLESTKISSFKDLVEIFEAKVAENSFFFVALFRNFDLNYLQDIIFK